MGGKVDYKSCCLYNGNHGSCGPFLRDKIEKEGVVCVTDLDADTVNHFHLLAFKPQDMLKSVQSFLVLFSHLNTQAMPSC